MEKPYSVVGGAGILNKVREEKDIYIYLHVARA